VAAQRQTLLRAFACFKCGRNWTSSDGKWPIQVTYEEPARVVAHCPDCAELAVGYEARCCLLGAVDMGATGAPAAR
jgi:hypothetical protein